MRIAVDAMGGDNAPDEVVHGAIEASRDGVDVVLVGEKTRIGPILESESAAIDVVHAAEVIEMADDPSRAIRDKKDASITVAARLVATGEAAGLVSGGSTGAAMAAAALIIGRLPGVARPAIASFFPTGKIVLDSGANLECRPEHLLQFAVMGSALSQVYQGKASPRVGLVTIGEEKGKGRQLERDAYELLDGHPGINFVGNVEGRDVVGDRADVLITDGFTGNVLLKTAEGTATMIMGYAKELLATFGPKQVAEIAPAFATLRHQLNPDRIGGGHLVGTRAVVVIAHGSASRTALANAIKMAAEGASRGLVDTVAAGMAAVHGAD